MAPMRERVVIRRVPVITLLVKAFRRWFVLFGGVTLFGFIGFELYRTKKVFIDLPVLTWLLAHRSRGLSRVMTAVTEVGRAEVLTAVVIVGSLLLAALEHRRSAFFLIASGAGAGILNAALKLVFARPRPDELLRVVTTEGYAFPSGHSMVSAAVYGALSIIVIARFPKHRWSLVTGCILLVGAIGVSRAYLYVHYPSDVLAGWALGLTWPLWLKSAILGHGFRPETVRDTDLVADGVNPDEVRGHRIS
jgi:undecaprenyl-diphosphatase